MKICECVSQKGGHLADYPVKYILRLACVRVSGEILKFTEQ